jgi:hypothetical protein
MAKFFTISVFLILMAAPGIFSAEKKFCDQCGNLIKPAKQYLTYLGRKYCDEDCFEKSLPKCAVCGNPVKQGILQDGKSYCSEECVKTTWNKCSSCGKKVSSGYHFGNRSGAFYCEACSKKTVCFACALPNDCSELDDGRKVCAKCNSSGITSHKKAADMIREIRRVMKEDLNIHTENDIGYNLVDLNTLKTKSDNSEMELGLYSHSRWKNTETVTKTRLGFRIAEEKSETLTDSFEIFILNHLPEEKFIEVAAHELAHDWMELKYPDIKDPFIAEGWAEFAASKVNSVYGNSHLNERMRDNPHPVYGKGYRFIEEYAGRNGFDGLLKMFEELNANKKNAGRAN